MSDSEDDDDELEERTLVAGEVGSEGFGALSVGFESMGACVGLRGGGKDERKERWRSCRGDAAGRWARDWVMVFVDGVRESDGAAVLGVPGVLASPLGIGLSLGRTDRADGVLEAPEPPLPSRFIGTPPAAGCALPGPEVVAVVFELPTFFICARTCDRCRS